MRIPRPLTQAEQDFEDACAMRYATGIDEALQRAAEAAFVAIDRPHAINPDALTSGDDDAHRTMMMLGQLLLPPDAADDDPLADLFDTLRRLLPGMHADGSPLSDAEILTRAIDRIVTLETDADAAAWHDVAKDPPPLRVDVLFANDDRFWVGQAREVTFTDMDTGEEATEIAYYEDGDLTDGESPIVWALLPMLGDPADPGLDPLT